MPRVPLSIKEAKNLVSTQLNSEFKSSEIPGYSWVERESNYGGIRQRWLVVKSEARTESDLASLEKKIAKESESIQKKITKLSQQKFKSETEAELNLKVTTPDSHPLDRERASPAHARDFAAPRHLSRQNAPDSPT
ncbi:MAG: hypothetical protein QNJ41_13460 [Xenococcaceae cyanobacterium MO_188.B32]|nr:hypothetical protein [Xenococcaceae cyanobacterium MO_188.B32]